MAGLADHVVLVTGASSGIGRATALELASQHAQVVLAARTPSRLDEVAALCRQRGAEALAVPTDLTVPDECRALVEQAVARFGRLDVVINNAGRAMWSRFDELLDLGVLEDVMRLNYLGSAYLTHFALPHLKQSRGRLAAVSSVAGLTGAPMLSGYSASKHALFGFFESLRIELRHTGVTVTMIAPDWVQSEILERSLDAAGRPLGNSPMDQSTLGNPDRCARKIIRGIAKRKRLVLMSERAKNLRLGKIIVPRFVDWLCARSIERR